MSGAQARGLSRNFANASPKGAGQSPVRWRCSPKATITILRTRTAPRLCPISVMEAYSPPACLRASRILLDAFNQFDDKALRRRRQSLFFAIGSSGVNMSASGRAMRVTSRTAASRFPALLLNPCIATINSSRLPPSERNCFQSAISRPGCRNHLLNRHSPDGRRFEPKHGLIWRFRSSGSLGLRRAAAPKSHQSSADFPSSRSNSPAQMRDKRAP